MPGPDTELTREEANAIRALERLASRWPASLKLVSWSGSLHIVRADVDYLNHDRPGYVDPNDAVITTIEGIPNDGGDP